MPIGWNRNTASINNVNYPYVYTSAPDSYNYYAHGEGTNSTSGHCLYFYKTSVTGNTNRKETAILPPVEDGIDMSKLQIRFWARLYSQKYAGNTLTIGIMRTTAEATFEAISTVTIGSTDYAEYTVPFTSYTNTGRYIAIRTNGTSGANVVEMLVDDITVEAIPATFTKEITGYGEGDGGYYLIAPPIDDVNPAEIDGMIATPAGNYDFYWFDQTQNLEWINYKAGVFNMVSGMGYLYANKNDVTLTFTGTPIDGPTYEVSLVKDDDAEFPGWNLVGNPFAEHTAYIDRDCYVMNPEGRFEIIATNTRSIEPMEGAFVIAAENDEPLVFSTEGSAKGSMITLNLSGPSTSSGTAVIDRAIVRFGAGRQLPKFQLRESSTKVYIPVGNQDYAVVCSEGMGEIPVNFKAENNGSYTLSFDSEEVNFNYLHLIDNMTSVETDLLANPSYSFEARTTDYESRFKLVFVANSEDGPSTGSGTFAFNSNGNWTISNEGEATLQVIDVNGQILKSENINGCGNVNVNVAAGVYLFRLVNGDIIKTQKVVIK